MSSTWRMCLKSAPSYKKRSFQLATAKKYASKHQAIAKGTEYVGNGLAYSPSSDHQAVPPSGAPRTPIKDPLPARSENPVKRKRGRPPKDPSIHASPKKLSTNETIPLPYHLRMQTRSGVQILSLQVELVIQ